MKQAKHILNYKKYTVSFIAIILIAFLYQLYSNYKDAALFFPSLNAIFSDFVLKLETKKTYIAILNTLIDLFVSLFISYLISFILAILSYRFKIFYYFIRPFITIFRVIPLISLYIFLFFIFTRTMIPKVLISVILIPICFEAIYNGLMAVEKKYIYAYKLESKFNFRILNKVYIPLISSYLKTGFIQSFGLGFKIIIMAEYLAYDKNTLGGLIGDYANSLNYVSVYSYTLIIFVLYIIFYIIIFLIKYFINKKKTI